MIVLMIKFFLHVAHQACMLCLVLAEAALELIPQEITTHPNIVRSAAQLGKQPQNILLDRSYHHTAMLSLPNHLRRGRPDIIHQTLLIALDTPLNSEGLLQTFIHTCNDQIIHINSVTRLPRNYERFKGLIEQLLLYGKVPKKGSPLLYLEHGSLSSIIRQKKPKAVLAFSKFGRFIPLEHHYTDYNLDDVLLVVVGAFPRGSLSTSLLNLATDVIAIDKESLTAGTVTSRLIYDYERIFQITQRRGFSVSTCGNIHRQRQNET
jgi:rRNA small subunit pseudouridine methyltransferase Nep1